MGLIVGVCQVEIGIDDNDTLKGKRSVVRKVIMRTRNQFNVAIAEVDDMDIPDRAVLGFAVVGNEKPFVNSCVDKIVQFIDGLGVAPVLDHQFEIVNYG